MKNIDIHKADIWLSLGFSFPITDRVMVAIEERQNQIAKLEKLEKALAKHRKDFPIFCDLYDKEAEPNRNFYKVSRERSNLIYQIMGLRKELNTLK
ncbi:hypothetical protein L8P30_09880 [Enterobacter asburiae]|uniref:hypothetical protein n=1 Tax=Enterobacter asburiae TaxID=61645 RepID=UPI0020061544|nr:hypothetical protein [Enterobacter asburiae]MCK7142559.1 hypothetical protein [Enterobacter asburiae]